MFPELVDNKVVQEAYISEADHTFILQADRVKLIALVREWFDGAVFDRTKS